MANVNMEWVSSTVIKSEHTKLPVKQVYIWYFTTEKHFVIVSKDNRKWQMPGGKPETGESLTQTAVREMLEETGIDIAGSSDKLTFFGYYVINETDDSQNTETYLQVRYQLESDVPAAQLNLSVEKEDAIQADDDQIKFVRSVSAQEVVELISWLPTTGEYKELHAQGLIA